MFRRKYKVIRQSEASECGLACVAMIAHYYGYRTDLLTLRRKFMISARGSRLSEILKIADHLGLTSSAFKLDAANLAQVRTPAMLLWNKRHFVVLKSVNRGGATVLDPALGQRHYKTAELAEHFSNIAVEIQQADGFSTGTDVTQMSLWHLLGRKSGFLRPILQGIGLSVLIQILLMVSPLPMQIAVDRHGRFQEIPLGLAALGFAGVAVFRAISVWARSWLMRRASLQIGTHITSQLFRKLIQLPVPWFERRHVGDVVSRFQSTKPVRDLLADKMIVGTSDILGAVFSAAMLLIYSVPLAGIVFGGILVVAALRAGFHGLLKQQQELSIAAGARENSVFLETARAIQTIKAATNESTRLGRWQEKHDERMHEEIRVTELNATLSNLSDLIKALVFILVVYVGIAMVRRHNLTLGMFYAMMTYRQLLDDRVKTLLDLSFEWLSVGLHVDRLSEIALAQVEPCEIFEDMDGPVPAIAGALRLREIGFCYSPADPPVLSGVNLDIAAGEFVAITGETGCGKTTLLKILAGLHAPTSGEMFVDARRLAPEDLFSYRRQVGVVLQDDVLLAGTVIENISMFDPDPDIGLIEECCRLAAIHDDIMALPLRYETLAGDMGSTMSGGQKQRLFLARALYRRPKILLADEGTSALDLKTEKTINRALKHLRMTRVVVAHRPDTIKAADRIIRMDRNIVNDTAGGLGVPDQAVASQV